MRKTILTPSYAKLYFNCFDFTLHIWRIVFFYIWVKYTFPPIPNLRQANIQPLDIYFRISELTEETNVFTDLFDTKLLILLDCLEENRFFKSVLNFCPDMA